MVSFVEEDGHPTAVVPMKCVKPPAIGELEKGGMCKVEWSDGNVHLAHWVSIITLKQYCSAINNIV